MTPQLRAARRIFRESRRYSRGDGRKIVTTLLAGRTSEELSVDELELLAVGYNWEGKDALALETAKALLRREPPGGDRLEKVATYMWNAGCRDLPGLLTTMDEWIAEGLGPPAFWHLKKLDLYLQMATGEMDEEDFEWFPGLPVRHPELLEPAARELAEALRLDPHVREQPWSGDWERRDALLG
jgi:hypothetical protein